MLSKPEILIIDDDLATSQFLVIALDHHYSLTTATDLIQPNPDRSMCSINDLERAHIVRVLEETRYNKTRTAEILGLDRVTLYRKAARYSIPLKKPNFMELDPETRARTN